MGVYTMKKILISSVFCVVSLFGNSIYATFDVLALKSASVAFNSGGIVDKIYVDIGSVVHENDMLAKINNDDVEAMLNVYQTTAKYAKKDYDRQVQIKKIIDKAKFDSYEKVYRSAQAQVKYQQAILHKTILKAPFDALVISKEIEVGDVVSAQQPKTAFTLQSIHKRKLVLQFDQKYHENVKVGNSYSYKLDGDTNEYSGIISKVYPYANTQTRKIKAEVLVDDIIVGLFGDGYITTVKE
jgi:RND family efflux transporter MFP subunit